MTEKRSAIGGSALTVTKDELVIDGADGAFRGFVHDLLAFSARAGQVRSGFGEVLGLSGAAYTILISISHLDDPEDGVGISRVAEHLHLSGAFVTIEVAKLVAQDLVQKRQNGRDRRRVLLTVTPEGRRRLKKLAPIQAEVNNALFAAMSAREFQLMRDLLARLVPCGDRALSLLAYLTAARSTDPSAAQKTGRKRIGKAA